MPSNERRSRMGREVPTDPGLEEIVAKWGATPDPLPVDEGFTDADEARYYNEARSTEIAKARAMFGHFISWRLARALPDWVLWPIVKKWSEEDFPPEPKSHQRTDLIGGVSSRIAKMFRPTRRPQQ